MHEVSPLSQSGECVQGCQVIKELPGAERPALTGVRLKSNPQRLGKLKGRSLGDLAYLIDDVEFRASC